LVFWERKKSAEKQGFLHNSSDAAQSFQSQKNAKNKMPDNCRIKYFRNSRISALFRLTIYTFGSSGHGAPILELRRLKYFLPSEIFSG
jgi:hypothetical protein